MTLAGEEVPPEGHVLVVARAALHHRAGGEVEVEPAGQGGVPHLVRTVQNRSDKNRTIVTGCQSTPATTGFPVLMKEVQASRMISDIS